MFFLPKTSGTGSNQRASKTNRWFRRVFLWRVLRRYDHDRKPNCFADVFIVEECLEAPNCHSLLLKDYLVIWSSLESSKEWNSDAINHEAWCLKRLDARGARNLYFFIGILRNDIAWCFLLKSLLSLRSPWDQSRSFLIAFLQGSTRLSQPKSWRACGNVPGRSHYGISCLWVWGCFVDSSGTSSSWAIHSLWWLGRKLGSVGVIRPGLGSRCTCVPQKVPSCLS